MRLNRNGRVIPADTPRPRRGPERPGRHMDPKRRWRSTGLWQRLRAQVLEEEDRCRRCGSTEDPTVDHIIPVEMGGARFERGNLQRLCGRCNPSKGARL